MKDALDAYLDETPEVPQADALDAYLSEESPPVAAQPADALAPYLQGEAPKPGTPKGNYKKTQETIDSMFDDKPKTKEQDEEILNAIMQEPMAGIAGRIQGVRNVVSSIDPVAIWLEKKLGGPNKFTTLGGLLPSAEEAHAQNVAARNQFNEEYGDFPSAQSGVMKGELVAAAPALVAGGALTSGAGQFVANVAPKLAPVVSFLGGTAEGPAALRYLSSGAAGAIGGAEGAAVTSGGSDVPFSEQVATGAGYGFGLGTLLPAAVDAGKGAVNFFTREKGSYAANKVLEAALADHGDLAAVQARLKELGPQASFADLGPNSAKLADRVNMTPGSGQTLITQALQQRQKDSAKVLLNSAAKNLKVHDEYHQTFEELNQLRKDRAAPLYKEAFAANKDITSTKLDRILETEAGQKALESTRKAMSDKMALMGVADPELVEQAKLVGQYVPGQGGISKGLKLETWDMIKQELDAMGQAAKKQASLGNVTTKEATRYKDLARGLRDELDELDITKKPGSNRGSYAMARDAWEGPTKSMEALEDGKDFLKLSKQEIQKTLKSLPAADQRMYRIGALQSMEKEILSSAKSADASRRLMGDFGFKEEKLRALFPSNKAFEAFKKQAEATTTFYQTKQRILGGSSTAPRFAASQEDDIVDRAFNVAGHAVNVVAGGKPGLLKSAAKGTAAGARALANKFTGFTPERAESMARLMVPGAQGSALNQFQSLRLPNTTPFSLPEELSVPVYGSGANLLNRFSETRN